MIFCVNTKVLCVFSVTTSCFWPHEILASYKLTGRWWRFSIELYWCFHIFPQDPYGRRLREVLRQLVADKSARIMSCSVCCVFCEMVPRILVIWFKISELSQRLDSLLQEENLLPLQERPNIVLRGKADLTGEQFLLRLILCCSSFYWSSGALLLDTQVAFNPPLPVPNSPFLQGANALKKT